MEPLPSFLTWNRHVWSVGWKDVRKVGMGCFASIIPWMFSLNIRNLESSCEVSQANSLCFRMNSTQILSIFEPRDQNRKFSWQYWTNDCRPHPFPQISSKQEWIYHRLFCAHRWCNMRWSWQRRWRRWHRGISKRRRFSRRWRRRRWWSRKRWREEGIESKTRRRTR